MKIVDKTVFPGLGRLYLARLREEPGSLVEFVDTLEPGVAKAAKWVMMVSTQLGCAVGCRFCDAGALGYRGNLDSREILDQVRYMIRRNPDLDVRRHPKLKIHFARMGEPALNPNVLEALETLARDFPHPGILPSLSTVAPKSPAVAPFFERLIAVKELFPRGRFQLQFSLHSTDPGRRRELVPIRTWSLEEVADYGARFLRPGDRKITLNFALGPDPAFDPAAAARVFPVERFLIKITPVNPTGAAVENGLSCVWTDAPRAVESQVRRLRELGFEVIVSPSAPEEVDAATSCGQLWSQTLKERSAVRRRSLRKDAESYVTAASLDRKGRGWREELERYGRRRFPLNRAKAGLLILDMQELFLSPDSGAYMPSARAVLGNVARLARAFRRSGRPVFFAYHAHEDPRRDGGLMPLWWKSVCREGTDLARIAPLLEPEAGAAFRKCRYSAWSNAALERALRRAGVGELVLAGVATNLCVESTARDAFDAGFQTFIAADAAAAHTEEFHLSALKTLAQGFSTVCLTREIESALGQPESSDNSSPRP
ncbi:MAG: isochorismatase family protein [Elusimicrobia bacterium]|nr:isochorismatase family protein [Elusimicrobiota bacterium]